MNLRQASRLRLAYRALCLLKQHACTLRSCCVAIVQILSERFHVAGHLFCDAVLA
jgi:hypothetical protein